MKCRVYESAAAAAVVARRTGERDGICGAQDT